MDADMSDGHMTARIRTPVQVRILRHDDVPDCDVVLTREGEQRIIACKTYEQAVTWARLECKSYKIPAAINQPRSAG